MSNFFKSSVDPPPSFCFHVEEYGKGGLARRGQDWSNQVGIHHRSRQPSQQALPIVLYLQG
jgi:hypothetical protein